MLVKLTLIITIILASASVIDFDAPAKANDVPPAVLEGVCRYESDNGRILRYKNPNKSWDVGFCMNHRKSKAYPKVPGRTASIREAAKELAYWKKQHKRFCVNLYKSTGKCGEVLWGKWRGVKNCHRPHHWFHHYNSGFRVLSNGYGDKVFCFIKNGFKKCTKKKWKALRRETFGL